MSECHVAGASVWHVLSRATPKWTRCAKLQMFGAALCPHAIGSASEIKDDVKPRGRLLLHTFSQLSEPWHVRSQHHTRCWTLLCVCELCMCGARVLVTCPVSCWHTRGWLAAGARCRRAGPLGGRVLLFAVAPHLGGACRLQTRLQAGSPHRVLEVRENTQFSWIKNELTDEFVYSQWNTKRERDNVKCEWPHQNKKWVKRSIKIVDKNFLINFFISVPVLVFYPVWFIGNPIG